MRDKKAYKINKKLADRIALWLNGILSVLGIGLICGIAIMAILPALPLAAFIPLLIGFSLLGGYVEGFVYHGFVQAFCRNLVRGFFESLENNILNREFGKEKWANMAAEERQNFLKKNKAARITEELLRDLGRKEWQKISAVERLRQLAKHKVELFIKKALAIAIIPVALASGVGFAGLAFTQLLSIMPILGVGAGVLSIAAPWVLAIIVGPLYAIVMYGMLYKAIKNNVFLKMKENIIDLLANKDNKHWAAHAGLCALKVLGLVLVLGISVAATLFTAGAWLESSVSFFATAVGLIDLISNKIGMAIGAIFLATGLWFSFEKSLETVKSFMQISPEAFKKPFSSPKKFLMASVQALLLAIHVVGTGAVGALGADLFQPLVNLIGLFWTKLTAVFIGVAEELIVDGGDYCGMHDHHHDEEGGHHHGHSHGNLIKDIIRVASWVGKMCQQFASFVAELIFGAPPAGGMPPANVVAEQSGHKREKSKHHHAVDPLEFKEVNKADVSVTESGRGFFEGERAVPANDSSLTVTQQKGIVPQQ